MQTLTDGVIRREWVAPSWIRVYCCSDMGRRCIAGNQRRVRAQREKPALFGCEEMLVRKVASICTTL